MSQDHAATAMTRNGSSTSLKRTTVGSGGTVSMSAYFRRDIRADEDRWEALLGWLEEHGLKGRYGRITLSIHSFELVVSPCSEAQVQSFVEEFEENHTTMVMVKAV